jgi:hypothetical protein
VLPANLALSVVIALDAEEAGTVPVEFRVLNNEKVVRTGRGTFAAATAGPAMTSIPRVLLKNVEAGSLSFQVRQPEGDWETICSLPVAPKAT